jgi:putative addiction module component (TIGR02574 family)
MDYAAVLAAAKKLDIDERTLLAWELWYGIEEEVRNAPLTEELKRELDRRLAEYEAHPERAVPWEEVATESSRSLPSCSRTRPMSAPRRKIHNGRTHDARSPF